jgi:hypothetical protein
LRESKQGLDWLALSRSDCTRDNEGMRKHIVDSASFGLALIEHPDWLHLEELAEVEVTSEDNDHPIESAFTFGRLAGWHAAAPGKQTIRLIFDQAQSIKRIYLRFNESEGVRTQEFALRWSENRSDPMTEIVRQQWNFSPQGSTTETEDYQVDLKTVSILELTINPDLGKDEVIAKLADWRLA